MVAGFPLLAASLFLGAFPAIRELNTSPDVRAFLFVSIVFMASGVFSQLIYRAIVADVDTEMRTVHRKSEM